MRKKGMPVMNVGISLLILVFMTLALLTFSVLALENAVADKRLSQKAADHTTAYYAAADRIQEQIADRMQEAEEQDLAAGTQFSFEEEVADGQMLTVSVVLTEVDGEKGFDVTRWQLRSSDEWEADRSLDVYQGE
ncbi:MAG TPA: hypothetical protein H9934_11875 [Candidatus Anaerobutyricum faecale]|uniref:hypothetical protein n=1 Tax=Eubacterium sp. An11 TaxID=1965542 RepID=UPI000B36A414|nr:hypothetical protein [Eubacterium sp. An11]OUQ68572.1 hypothetical protein B5E53_06150 [Eubacterium sp. An11]HJC32813.1 hypothetical protein [Candidatus Anaerobutyricum faecale]